MALELYDFETGSMSQYDIANAWVASPGVKAYSAVTPAITGTAGYDFTSSGTQGRAGYIDGVTRRSGTYSWHHFHNYIMSGDYMSSPSGPENPSVYYTPYPFKGWADPRILPSAWHDADSGAQFSYGFSFRLPPADDPVPWIVTPGWGDFYQFHTGNSDHFDGSIIKLNIRGTSAVPTVELNNFGGQGSYVSGYCHRQDGAEHVPIINAVELGAWYDVILRVKWGTNGTKVTVSGIDLNVPDPTGQVGSIEVWVRKAGDGAFTSVYSNLSVPTTSFAKSGATYAQDTLGYKFCRTFLDIGLYHQWSGTPGQTNHLWYDCNVRSALAGDDGLDEVLGYFDTVEAISGGTGGGTPTGPPTDNFLGNTDLTGVSFSGMTVNLKRMNKFTLATDTVDVTAIGLRIQGDGGTGTNLLKCVLYSDDGSGNPDALLATTSESTVDGSDAAAWVEKSTTATARLTPGDYHLGTITGPGTSSGSRAQIGTVAGSHVFNSNADTYSDGPSDPAGTMTTTIATDLVMAIYAKYTVASGDTTAPALVSATINGDTLTLVYNEALDSASVPAVTAFSIAVNGGSAVNPTEIAVILVDTVVMMFADPVVNTDTVTVSYTAPGSNKLQDVASTPNAAGNLSGQAVTNDTPVPHTTPTYNPLLHDTPPPPPPDLFP